MGLDTPHTLNDTESLSASLSWDANNSNTDTDRGRNDAGIPQQMNSEDENLTLGLDSTLSDETSASIGDIPFLA